MLLVSSSEKELHPTPLKGSFVAHGLKFVVAFQIGNLRVSTGVLGLLNQEVHDRCAVCAMCLQNLTSTLKMLLLFALLAHWILPLMK